MPVVNPDIGRLFQRLKRHWRNGLLVAGLMFNVPLSIGEAQDGFHDHAAKPDNWRWWHIVWFQKDGNPRYGGGLGGMSRQHAPRLMTRPPLCPPEYGYFQPCWRQLPVTPRCFTCETVPANFAVPCEQNVFDLVPPPPSPAVPVPQVVPEIPRPELAVDFPETTASEVPVPDHFGFVPLVARAPSRGEWVAYQVDSKVANGLIVPAVRRATEQAGTPE